jgi:ribosome assembly protein YihI (activator of Der GTPase)
MARPQEAAKKREKDMKRREKREKKMQRRLDKKALKEEGAADGSEVATSEGDSGALPAA